MNFGRGTRWHTGVHWRCWVEANSQCFGLIVVTLNQSRPTWLYKDWMEFTPHADSAASGSSRARSSVMPFAHRKLDVRQHLTTPRPGTQATDSRRGISCTINSRGGLPGETKYYGVRTGDKKNHDDSKHTW